MLCIASSTTSFPFLMNELDCYFHTVTQRYMSSSNGQVTKTKNENDFGEHLIVFFSTPNIFPVDRNWCSALGTSLNHYPYTCVRVASRRRVTAKWVTACVKRWRRKTHIKEYHLLSFCGLCLWLLDSSIVYVVGCRSIQFISTRLYELHVCFFSLLLPHSPVVFSRFAFRFFLSSILLFSILLLSLPR